MSDAKKHRHALRRPVAAHGEEVDHLELAEPDTRMVMDLGYPFLVVTGDAGAGVQLQPKVAARYLSRLAGVPVSTIERLAISDLQELQAWLMGFFGDGPQEN